MPVKYKKMIVLFTLVIMLIGMGTFSMLTSKIDFGFAKMKTGINGGDLAVDGKTDKEIEEEIEGLVNKYFEAKLAVNIDKLGRLVSDVSHINEKKLIAEAEYIKAYTNVKCTFLKTDEKGCYRVYAYHEDKYYDIDATIPSLTALYIKPDKKGKFKIYTGTLTSKETKNIEKLDKTDTVQKLTEQVNAQLQELVEKDSAVKDFYEMISNKSDDEKSGESASKAAADKDKEKDK